MKRKILILTTLTILILFSSFAFAQDDSTGEIVSLENNTEDHIIAETARHFKNLAGVCQGSETSG